MRPQIIDEEAYVALIERMLDERVTRAHPGIDRFVPRARLVRIACRHMAFEDDVVAGWTSRHDVRPLDRVCHAWFRPCLRRRGVPAWVAEARRRGARVIELAPLDGKLKAAFDDRLDAFVDEFARLARMAEDASSSVRRGARKTLAGHRLADPGERHVAICALEATVRRASVRARMAERRPMPDPLAIGALTFAPIASAAELDALGLEAGNCLARSCNDGEGFHDMAWRLLEGETCIWTVRLDATLLSIVEVDVATREVGQVKGPRNAPPPLFIAEAMHDFLLAQGYVAAGADLRELGVVEELKGRDRSRPDAVIWDDEQACRVWIDEACVVIVADDGFAVLPTRQAIGKPLSRRWFRHVHVHDTMPDALAHRRLRLLRESPAGASRTVRSVAAFHLKPGEDEGTTKRRFSILGGAAVETWDDSG